MPARFWHLALAALLVVTIPAPVRAAAQENALRPEVGKPLQATEALIKQQKLADALAEVRKAAAAAPLTPKETALVEELRGIATVGTGDIPTAVKSFETAIATGRLTPAEQLRLTRMVAVLSYQAQDYPNAIIWAKRQGIRMWEILNGRGLRRRGQMDSKHGIDRRIGPWMISSGASRVLTTRAAQMRATTCTNC